MPDSSQVFDLVGFINDIDLGQVGNIIVFCFVFLSLGISLFSLRISLRSTIATSISTNRINWIGTVRQLVLRFLTEYSGNRNREKLKQLYTEIALYCNPRHEIYSNMIHSMQKCILSECYIDAYYWEVLSEAQRVLDSSWLRMKREAGISRKEDLKMADMLSARFKDTYEATWTAEIKNPPHRLKYRKKKVCKSR